MVFGSFLFETSACKAPGNQLQRRVGFLPAQRVSHIVIWIFTEPLSPTLRLIIVLVYTTQAE